MSPRAERTNRKLREDSQQRILAASLRVFAEHGYENATISQITERAAVSRGLISYYFPSKRDLLVAILGQWLDGMLTLLDDLDDALPPDEFLAAVIDRTVVGASTHLDMQRLVLCLMLQPGTREVYARVERDRSEKMAAFEDRLRAIFAARGAADPAVEEVMLRSVLEGVLFKLAVYESTYPLDAARSWLYARYDLSEPAPLDLPAHVFNDTWRLRARLI